MQSVRIRTGRSDSIQNLSDAGESESVLQNLVRSWQHLELPLEKNDRNVSFLRSYAAHWFLVGADRPDSLQNLSDIGESDSVFQNLVQ